MKISVIGAGLMGRVIAMRLSQTGFNDITLFDKDEPSQKSSPAYIAAGMLATLSESVLGGPIIYNLGKESINLWVKYLSEIGSSQLLKAKGSLLIAEPRFSNEIIHYLAKINFNSNVKNYFLHLNRLQLKELESEVNFDQAYHLYNEGMLDAPQVMHTLELYLKKCINWQDASNIEITTNCGMIFVNGKPQNFELVIDARGMGSRQIFPELRAVRGEIIRVYAPDVNIQRPIRLFHPRHNIYIAPYKNNHYAIGATELESEDYSPLSVRSALELLSSACIVNKSFAEARIISMDTNCRPTLNNNLPQIKQSGKVIAINGLYRHGFLLAPSLAEDIIKYILTHEVNFLEIWRHECKLY